MGQAVLLRKEPAAHHRIACKGKEGDLAELEEHRDADHPIEDFARGCRAKAIEEGQQVILVNAGSANIVLFRITTQIEVDKIVSYVELPFIQD